jgi:murein DD-endopeptidase MepM/ murein hydrolase activator NlpD
MKLFAPEPRGTAVGGGERSASPRGRSDPQLEENPMFPRPTRPLAAAFAAALAAAPAVHAAAALEVRFYPQRSLHVHALDDQRGVASAVLQNAAVVNRGDAPVTLAAIDLELLAGGEVAQRHPLAGEALAAVAARSGRLAASGMIDAFVFHFAPAKLLAGARPVGSTTLAPGEALLVGHRVFALQGSGVDKLRLTARGAAADGAAVEGGAELAIVRTPPAAGYRFPLSGTWTVAAGASLHSHHRWVVPEEFALDILRFGADGRTYRADGAANEDFHAWGAPVRVVADGEVVRVVDRFDDGPIFRRAPGEAPEAYLGRVQQAQMALFAQGLDAIGGNVVVVEHANGEYSHYAHLQRGSVAVAVGDAVKAGQLVGRLGNSGNSTEPHLHFQVTDGPDTLLTVGLPVVFEGIEIALADLPRALQTGDVVVAE